MHKHTKQKTQIQINSRHKHMQNNKNNEALQWRTNHKTGNSNRQIKKHENRHKRGTHRTCKQQKE
jgi:hypothetical protein